MQPERSLDYEPEVFFSSDLCIIHVIDLLFLVLTEKIITFVLRVRPWLQA